MQQPSVVRTRSASAEWLLAEAAFQRSDFAEAREIYTQMLADGVETYAVQVNLAQCCKRLGDWTLAMRHFRAGFDLHRRRLGSVPDEAVSAFYLAHLAEQVATLTAHGDAAVSFEQAAHDLKRAAKFARDCYGASGTGPLPPDIGTPSVRALIHGCANYVEPPALPAILNANPSVTTIDLGPDGDCVYILDDILLPAALKALRRFLVQSTIWYDARPQRQYLGAHLHDGLAGDFLLSMIDDVQACFERFVGRCRIAQVWAFKYAPSAPGIDLHADQAQWNLNIWPTDERWNRDPESGGMTIFGFKAPDDWSFHRYNASPDQNRKELAAAGIAEVTIPYRGNRAVLFPSRYLHKTDTVDFKDDYVGRRINMTFMADRM